MHDWTQHNDKRICARCGHLQQLRRGLWSPVAKCVYVPPTVEGEDNDVDGSE